MVKCEIWNCTCQIDCAENVVAYEVWYELMIALNLFGTFLIFCYTLRQLYLKLKSSHFNTAICILLINLFALMCLLFSAGAEELSLRLENFERLGQNARIILLRLPQVAWLTDCFVLVFFWKTMLKRSRQLARYKGSKKLNLIVTVCIAVLLCIQFPLQFAPFLNIDKDLVWAVGNSVMALYTICLTIGSFIYGRRIAKLIKDLSSLSGNKESSKAIHVQKTVWSFTLVGVLMCSAVVWNILDQDHLSDHLIFHYIVLLLSFCIAFLLTYSVSSSGHGKKNGMSGETKSDIENTHSSQTSNFEMADSRTSV